MDFKNFQTQSQQFFSKIDNQTKNIGPLNHFESLTKLPRSYAVVAFIAIYLLLTFLNFGNVGAFLSNIAGFVYPCYLSLKALKTSNTKDDTQLLTYWVVFAFLNVLEFWTKAVLYWVPSYFLLKTFFLLYLASPVTNGSEKIYLHVIKPIADKVVKTDEAGPASDLLNKVQEKVQ